MVGGNGDGCGHCLQLHMGTEKDEGKKREGRGVIMLDFFSIQFHVLNINHYSSYSADISFSAPLHYGMTLPVAFSILGLYRHYIKLNPVQHLLYQGLKIKFNGYPSFLNGKYFGIRCGMKSFWTQ